MTKICKLCGKGHGRNSETCCNNCYQKQKRKHNRKVIIKLCIVCRREHTRQKSQFCSEQCKGKIERTRDTYKKTQTKCNHQWYINNIKKSKENSRSWKINNRERCLCRSRTYRHEHKERDSKKRKQRRLQDVNYRLKTTLRSRLTLSIKNGQKAGSAIKDLGCSINKLKLHLQKTFYRRFQDNEIMTWDNWSLHGWHIDHIIPLDHFDLSIPEELKKACHYTNLQPMWAEENLKKSNKLPQTS